MVFINSRVSIQGQEERLDSLAVPNVPYKDESDLKMSKSKFCMKYPKKDHSQKDCLTACSCYCYVTYRRCDSVLSVSGS